MVGPYSHYLTNNSDIKSICSQTHRRVTVLKRSWTKHFPRTLNLCNDLPVAPNGGLDDFEMLADNLHLLNIL